jgi:hypothetical protein
MRLILVERATVRKHLETVHAPAFHSTRFLKYVVYFSPRTV